MSDSDRPEDNISSDGQDFQTELRDSVELLEATAPVPPKQRQTSVANVAKDIASYAYRGGIPSDILSRLIDVLTRPNHLDQTTITTLVKNLYPLDKVSSDVVTRVVCSLGPGKAKPSPATQVSLVRWLLLVYEYLEDQSHLAKLYSVLFNLLDMISLRRSLCHLLSLITRRRHVKPYRIQFLMELLRNGGEEEKELLGFLRVYKNYYPDIVIGETGRSRFFFKHPDPEWTSHVQKLQERNRERALAASMASGFQVVRRGGVKRSKVEAIIPEVQTSRVHSGHTSLEELRSVTDFVERMEKIDLPNQMVSVLTDRLAQKYMVLVENKDAKERLEDWLEGFFKDELDRVWLNVPEEAEALGYVLDAAANYARATKRIPNAVTSFLRRYLRLWDGRSNRREILDLLQCLPRGPFDTLRKDYLEPLENAVLDHSPASRSILLDFYTELIRQWGLSLRAEGHVPSSKGYTPLISLITHAERLALSALEFPSMTEDASSRRDPVEPIPTAILHFYASLSELYSHAAGNGQIRLTIPLSPTVYNLAFRPNLAQISLLCGVLATYKTAFEQSLTSPTLQSPVKSVGAFYASDMVGRFNGYVMDLCNLLWRNRALNSEDPNALGCLLPANTRTALHEFTAEVVAEKQKKRLSGSADGFQYSLPLMFSLSHNVALAAHSAACFAAFEEEVLGRDDVDAPRLSKPVTQKNLTALEKQGGAKISWQDYRIRMLEWLDQRGSFGIGKLMRSTMKALRKDT